jgi:hypothetical protein
MQMQKKQQQRIWSTMGAVSPLTPLYIWDAGCEFWEMYEGGEIRHFRVIDRIFLNKEMTRMKEILECLEESTIPREIYAKHARREMKWHIEKECIAENTDCPAVWELTPLAPWIPSNVLLPAICQ